MVTQDRIHTLAERLIHLRKHRERIKIELEQIAIEEKRIAKELVCITTGIPIEDTALKVKLQMKENTNRLHEVRVTTGLKTWEKKSPEEKKTWREKIWAGRMKKKLNLAQPVSN